MTQTWVHNLFELIGVIVCVGLIGVIGYLIVVSIKDTIEDMIYDYRIKHRFDKPPVARCYCVDCSFHDIKGTNKCNLPGSSRYTPPGGFCYEAKPKKK